MLNVNQHISRPGVNSPTRGPYRYGRADRGVVVPTDIKSGLGPLPLWEPRRGSPTDRGRSTPPCCPGAARHTYHVSPPRRYTNTANDIGHDIFYLLTVIVCSLLYFRYTGTYNLTQCYTGLMVLLSLALLLLHLPLQPLPLLLLLLLLLLLILLLLRRRLLLLLLSSS